MLSNVVPATGGTPFPTATALHEALKLDLGYVSFQRHLDGKVTAVPDSTAFNSMDQAEFKAFFEAAVKRITEVFHFDPVEMEEAA